MPATKWSNIKDKAKVMVQNKNVFQPIGTSSIVFFQDIGEMTLLLLQSIKGAFSRKLNLKNTFEQMVRIGNDSLPVTLITAFFVGMVFAVQIANEFTKFGAGKMVGGIMSIAIARELAPVLTAVVLAGRIGAAIAAELGTMNVTQQIDAIRALGTDPVKYLVVPRFLAAAIMFPVLTVLADIVGFVGSLLVSNLLVQINPYGYMETAEQFLKINDVMGGLLKSVIFGILISIIACYKGMNAKNGAKGVGEATTNSVVISLITIFIANYFLSVAFFR
jgi:phospholipid/cholesterol/gamma-HCH transport system permease protein